jgi:hypothetical protein
MQLFIYFYFDRIVCDLLILMPFWLVCILHMELSFLVCVVNEFWVSKHHHSRKFSWGGGWFFSGRRNTAAEVSYLLVFLISTCRAMLGRQGGLRLFCLVVQLIAYTSAFVQKAAYHRNILVWSKPTVTIEYCTGICACIYIHI